MIMEVLSYKIGKFKGGECIVEVVDSSGSIRVIDKLFKTYMKAKYWCLMNLNVRQG